MYIHINVSYQLECIGSHTCSYSRWLKVRGVTLPSEKKLRALYREILGGNLHSEAAPFSFALKHGGEDLRPAPLVFVPNLADMISQHLDQNDRYTHINF